MLEPAKVHPAALPPATLLEQCRMERTRGSGPGGQHRNKVETAVRLVHSPTGVTGQASERRSQLANRDLALKRLRLRLAVDVRHPSAHEASTRWRARRQGGRLAINPDHDDYPALLAEALDALAAKEHDLAAAAGLLAVSPSQIVKLLRHEPAALEQVNAARARRGQHPLK